MNFEARFRSRLGKLEEEGNLRHLSESRGLSFIHNDYLNLSHHPELIAAGQRALGKFGTSSRGSRLLGGNSILLENTEAEIAGYFQSPAALLFSTGYLANLAILQTLSECVSKVYSDSLNHASLVEGIRHSGLEKNIVPHGKWSELESQTVGEDALLVSESLFSMDGDLMQVSSIEKLWQASGAFLFVDEAHAGGIFGEDGRGLWIPKIRDWERAAVSVTFGKTFAVSGAAILCSESLKQLLINRARSFIYTTAPPPQISAVIAASLRVVREESWRREELWSRAEWVRATLRRETPEALLEDRSLSPWCDRSPIIPFLIGGSDRTLRFCQSMRKSGFELKAIRHPTVPKGSERVRISLNLGVSRDNTESMTGEVVTQWKAFSLQERIQASAKP